MADFVFEGVRYFGEWRPGDEADIPAADAGRSGVGVSRSIFLAVGGGLWAGSCHSACCAVWGEIMALPVDDPVQRGA